MPRLLDRLNLSDVPRLNDEVTLDDLAGLLAASKTPLQVVTGLAITASDLVAGLAYLALGGENSLGLPLVQAQPMHPEIYDTLKESSLAPIFGRASRGEKLCLVAGLFQIFDFWDASHAVAQEADELGEGVDSAYWHAIAHRREPDPGNAAYWFRRVGRHPILPTVAEHATDLIDAAGRPAWAQHLVAQNTWDTLGFVRACGMVKPGSPDEALARRLQRLEMLTLLDHTLEHAIH